MSDTEKDLPIPEALPEEKYDPKKTIGAARETYLKGLRDKKATVEILAGKLNKGMAKKIEEKKAEALAAATQPIEEPVASEEHETLPLVSQAKFTVSVGPGAITYVGAEYEVRLDPTLQCLAVRRKRQHQVIYVPLSKVDWFELQTS